jgi:alcohol dehydrogenase class IV
MTALRANWTYPTQARVGAGRIAELPESCREAGISRPLFVTDPGLAGLDMTQRALTLLRAAGIEAGIFSDVRPNPTEENVAAGLVRMREGGHDGVIAFGGGSALDAGKAIAFMRGQTLPIWDFEDVGDNWRRADPEAIAPVVAVPTTAGTGSEVGRAAVITRLDQRVKKVIFHPRMMPAVVILDPELTAGLPADLTAWTGMDAFTHCLEAYCAPGFHPMAEGIAVEGMRLVRENLPRAVADGTDLEARQRMLAAAAMGAVAFQKGLGGIHALSHPVGALYDTHHGLTNAILIPYLLDFNRDEIEPKIDRLAAWLGLADGFAGFVDLVLRLRRDLGIPHTLDRIGVDGARVGEMARMALEDPTAAGNPRPLTEADILDLYDRALNGRLG